ncbi:FMN-binding protein [Vitiosangium sp. GDMCC 1.1324]|uniref:FMN-binding protein n=1 Tax=Vitiosangium sp. (strain GDMCC 1.1324) TaxID=2138576 RepID=UPI001E44059A|nr:FMN-binding protein [Vitiosangium sp. GDMCC 1.1324]
MSVVRGVPVKHLSLALAVWLGSGASLPAEAAGTYFTTPQILKEFFPKCQRVSYRKVKLGPAELAAVQGRLGYKPAKSEYVIFVASTGEHVDGYAIIDEELGQHEQITFAVKLSPAGVVERHEVMVYREKYGEEITDARFRRQFQGKTVKDPVRAGVDIDVVTGASISSRSMAIGVRRALVLLDELILKPGALSGALLTAPTAPKG